jgi:hypothetical protein
VIELRRVRWVVRVARVGGKNAYKDLVGKLQGKRLFGRFRHQCQDNIKTDLKEVLTKFDVVD